MRPLAALNHPTLPMTGWASTRRARALALDVSLEQVPVGATPADPFRRRIENSALPPRDLRLSPLRRELAGPLPHCPLLSDDLIDQAGSRAETDLLGEQLQTAPPVRRRGKSQPPQAGAVGA